LPGYFCDYQLDSINCPLVTLLWDLLSIFRILGFLIFELRAQQTDPYKEGSKGGCMLSNVYILTNKIMSTGNI